MNYLKQLNSFYELLLSNPLNANSQCLYFSLLNINNKCNWKKEFTVANSTLMIFTGLNISSLQRARNNLIQKGLIKYQKGQGNKAGVYEIIKFEQQSEQQTEQQSEQQSEQQTDTLDKLKETKQKKIKKEIYKEKMEKMINDFTKNKNVSQALYDFIEYRESRKNSVTEKALQIMLNKFKNWNYNDAEIIEVLNESIMNNWTGIFELKQRIPQVIPIEEYREIDTSNMTSEEYLALVRGERNV